MLKIGQLIRSTGSRRAHVDALAWLALDHLQTAKKAKPRPDWVSEADFNIFLHDIERALNAKSASYDWFLVFNVRLVSLFSDPKRSIRGTFADSELGESFANFLFSEKNGVKTYLNETACMAALYEPKMNHQNQDGDPFTPGMFALLSRFPEVVLFPTSRGALPYNFINRLFGTGIYPLGVVFEDKNIVDHRSDDRKQPPLIFFIHDIFHAGAVTSKNGYWPPIYNRLMEGLAFGSPLFRQRAWFYFVFSHENHDLERLISEDGRVEDFYEFYLETKSEVPELLRDNSVLYLNDNGKELVIRTAADYANAFKAFTVALRAAAHTAAP